MIHNRAGKFLGTGPKDGPGVARGSGPPETVAGRLSATTRQGPSPFASGSAAPQQGFTAHAPAADGGEATRLHPRLPPPADGEGRAARRRRGGAEEPRRGEGDGGRRRAEEELKESEHPAARLQRLEDGGAMDVGQGAELT